MSESQGVKATKVEREVEFLSLLAQHKTILFKVATAYCRSADDRADLVAEMTAALWKSFGRYDDRYRFSTWMYRVVLNVAVSAYRSERRRSRHFAAVDLALIEVATDEGAPDEDQAALHAFVAELGEIDKAMMLLYLENYRYEEIATMLGLTQTNVATKLARLKAKARIALRRGDTPCEGGPHGI
jgi:RNA polymerase sigma-70 factor (ECF subfamily)